MKEMFAVDDLLFSKEFQELQRLQKELNPFEVLGIQTDEVAHSRVLARILSSYGYLGFGTDLVPEMIRLLIQRCQSNQIIIPQSLLISFASAKYKTFVEQGRIDILLVDEVQKILIAIENKIYADERDNQILDYRKYLQVNYPNYSGIFIFLTPEGRIAQTHNVDCEQFPCYPLSYQDIFNALENYESKDITGVIKQLRTNIRIQIMGDNIEKELVRKLMANPDIARTLSIINRNMPKITDIEDEFLSLVNSLVEIPVDKKDVSYFPQRGQIREIKIHLPEFDKIGLKFTFIIYEGEHWPACRVFIWEGHFKKSQDKLIELSEKNIELASGFPKLRKWNAWHKVLAEEDYPEQSYVHDLSYTKETAKNLFAIFEKYYLKLKTIVK